MFLDDDELYILTGYHWRSKQVAELRRMGIPFRVNAAGRPAVARSAIEGAKPKAEQPKKWRPSWAANHP